MKSNFRSRNCKVLLVVILSVFTTSKTFAQLIYQPYSYQFYQKLNTSFYNTQTSLHTALKPALITDSSSVRPAFDSLMNIGADQRHHNWIHQIIFNTHLVDIKNKDYTFYLDFLPDFQVGREFNDKKTTYLNTRGYQVAGTIGSKFLFYTSGYENQGTFANYQYSYIRNTGMVPGQAYNRRLSTADWSLVTALIAYQPSKAITVELGEDKTFIGDGYRSVLLSDYAAAYPMLRLRANLGKHVQYMAMWAYMQDQRSAQFNSFFNNRRKWGVFHHVDWNITNRASIGFFNALIAAEANDQGQLHGFDLNYINPLFFASSLGPSNRIPDHTLFGFNGKYKIFNQSIIYGQLLYDQAPDALNSTTRKAWQLGFRGSNLFKIQRLNYLMEFNTAAPYTYTNQYPIVNYAQLNEPLAHPYGANFREWVGMLNYSIHKFDFQGQFIHAQYGLDLNGINYGKTIWLSDHTSPSIPGNTTGQGLNTNMNYAELTTSYLLNPKYNLRIEAGGLLRDEKNNLSNTKTALITFGLRSSFRNLYHDF